jgi:hypothetical protein
MIQIRPDGVVILQRHGWRKYSGITAHYTLKCSVERILLSLLGSKSLSTSAEKRWFSSLIILSATEKMSPAIIL